MDSELDWVLVSSGTQFQPLIILKPDYPLECLSVSYDYIWWKNQQMVSNVFVADQTAEAYNNYLEHVYMRPEVNSNLF